MTQLHFDRSLPVDFSAAPAGSPFKSPVAFPRHYVWLLGLAAMDVFVTWLVLRTGGTELNALARLAIERAGVFGMISIKAATMAMVLAICDYVGRRRPRTGRRLAEFALAANPSSVAP
jgi:hypothetical protein